MLLYNSFKYVTYTNHEDQDLLFDLNDDPYEMVNAIDRWPDVLNSMRQMSKQYIQNIAYHVEKSVELSNNIPLLSKWGALPF